MRRCLVPMLLVTGVLMAACSGGSGGDIEAALERFDPAPEKRSWSYARLDVAALGDAPGAREAALDALGSDDPNVRLGALHVLSLTAEQEDVDALAPFVDSSSPPERLLAAGTVLSLGDGRGVPALIEALRSDEYMPWGGPEPAARQYAAHMLLTFTGQDFGLSEAQDLAAASATQPDWEAWWAEAQGSFEVVRRPGRFG